MSAAVTSVLRFVLTSASTNTPSCTRSDFIGGLVPLFPYFFISNARDALWVSCAITAVVLLVFGAFKTFYTGAEIGESRRPSPFICRPGLSLYRADEC